VWGLPIDNDSDDRVAVFLGDLGESLSYAEQLYWRSFNTKPFGDGRDLSETTIQRSFEAEPADPKSPDLVFKEKLIVFQEEWEARFGWQLIRPLRHDDAHTLSKLRVPLTKSVVEFEDQILGLTKLVVDSLNNREIVRVLGVALPDEKGISKLERFLSAKAYPFMRRDIDLLRLLQEARSSGSAHRKSDGFKKVSVKLGLGTQTPPEVFVGLLRRVIEMFEGLKEFFLSPPTT